MPSVLQLSDRSPIASGTLRRVYAHPDAPDRLVKVIRPEIVEKRWGKGSAWYKRFRRVGRFIAVQREVEEYLARQETIGQEKRQQSAQTPNAVVQRLRALRTA